VKRLEPNEVEVTFYLAHTGEPVHQEVLDDLPEFMQGVADTWTEALVHGILRSVVPETRRDLIVEMRVSWYQVFTDQPAPKDILIRGPRPPAHPSYLVLKPKDVWRYWFSRGARTETRRRWHALARYRDLEVLPQLNRTRIKLSSFIRSALPRRGSEARRTSVQKGEVLHHGTSESGFVHPDAPAWFSNAEAVARYFSDWRGGNPRKRRVLSYRATRRIPGLALVRDKREMDRLMEEVAPYEEPTGSEEMASAVCKSDYAGWRIPENYPEGNDTLLCSDSDVRSLEHTGTVRVHGSRAKKPVEYDVRREAGVYETSLVADTVLREIASTMVRYKRGVPMDDAFMGRIPPIVVHYTDSTANPYHLDLLVSKGRIRATVERVVRLLNAGHMMHDDRERALIRERLVEESPKAACRHDRDVIVVRRRTLLWKASPPLSDDGWFYGFREPLDRWFVLHFRTAKAVDKIQKARMKMYERVDSWFEPRLTGSSFDRWLTRRSGR